MTLSKKLDLSKPWFLYLWNGGRFIYLVRFLLKDYLVLCVFESRNSSWHTQCAHKYLFLFFLHQIYTYLRSLLYPFWFEFPCSGQFDKTCLSQSWQTPFSLPNKILIILCLLTYFSQTWTPSLISLSPYWIPELVSSKSSPFPSSVLLTLFTSSLCFIYWLYFWRGIWLWLSSPWRDWCFRCPHHFLHRWFPWPLSDVIWRISVSFALYSTKLPQLFF